MKTANTINDVLNERAFSDIEKKAFTDCIKAVKAEQQDISDTINAEDTIREIIKGVTEE